MKLFNSDSLHTASLYVDQQMRVASLTSQLEKEGDPFLDFAKELDKEALTKKPQVNSSALGTSPDMNSPDKAKMSAIPELDLLALQKNQMGFIKNLDPLVALVEFIHGIAHFHDTKSSVIALFTLSFLIIHFEIAIALVPLGIICLIFYNRFEGKKFQKFDTNLVKNIRMV